MHLTSVDVEDVKQPPLESASVYNEEREFLGERLPSRSELSLLSLPVEARVPNSIGSYYFPRDATGPVVDHTSGGTSDRCCRSECDTRNCATSGCRSGCGSLANREPAITAARIVNDERHRYFSFAEYIAAEVPIHYQKYYIEYEQCKDLIRHLALVPEALRLGTFDIAQFPPKVRRIAEEVTEASLLSQHVPNLKDDLARIILPQAIFREFITRQLNKINQFAAERYNTIQQEIRNLYREIQQLITTDQTRFELQRSSSNGSTISSESSEPAPPAPNLDVDGFPRRSQGPIRVASSPAGVGASAISELDTPNVHQAPSFPSLPLVSEQLGRRNSQYDCPIGDTGFHVGSLENQQHDLVQYAAQYTTKVQGPSSCREGTGDCSIKDVTPGTYTQSTDDPVLKQSIAISPVGAQLAPSSDSGLMYKQPPRSKSAEELRDLVALSQNSPTISSSVFTSSLKSKALISESEYNVWRASALANVEQALDGQSAEIIHLDMFVRINFKGLLRLCEIFDKVTDSTVTPWLTASIMLELFANLDIDRLLVFLSVVWDKYRAAVGRTFLDDCTASTWVPPESFIRNTTKYWVRPDQVVRTKVAILKHMPYLIFGRSKEDLEATIDPYSALPRISKPKKGDHRSQANAANFRPSKLANTSPTAPNDVQKSAAINSQAATVHDKAIEESQLVSSIYLDSPDAYCYRRRILRMEGAQLVRFRWYADNTGGPDKPIFVERKTHHESWSGDKSTKDRFCLPQDQIFGFMKRRFDVVQYLSKERERLKKPLDDPKFKKCLHLAKEIQKLITEHKLQPTVRTSYQRAAFQLASSNAVRFSLDCNLCMVDEYIPDGHPTEPWCRLGEEICGKEQVVRFPYAVLEVKLQTEEPPWVSKILADVGATLVYKFSKFQHGMAFLHRDFTEPHGMPHWIHEFEELGFGSGYYGARSGPDFDSQLHVRRHTLGVVIPSEIRPSETAPSQLSESPSMRSLGPDGAQQARELVMSRESGWASTLLSPVHRMADAVHLVGSIGASLLHLKSPLLRTPAIEQVVSGGVPGGIQALETAKLQHEQQSSYKSPDVVNVASTTAAMSLCLQRSPVSPRNHTLERLDMSNIDPTTFYPHITSPSIMTLRWLESKTPTLDQASTLQWIHSRSKTVWKMDPKATFAAERTFLHYAQKGLFLAGLSVALVSFGNTATRGVGIMLGAVCISVFAFSYNVFHERLRAIERRRTKPLPGTTERLDSASGPVVLMAVVSVTILLAILANFVFGGGFNITNKLFPSGGVKQHRNRHMKPLLRGRGQKTF